MKKLLLKLLRIKLITTDNNKPYLYRWSILKTKNFAIKVHHIVDSDDACLHSHPWKFISFILKGGYNEWVLNEDGTKSVKTYKPFSILKRKAEHFHRLELRQDKNGNLIPATTFVITFKKTQTWGFITNAGKWIFWKDYHSGSEKC